MIPVNEPLLDGNEKKYLAECINSGWVSSEGPFVKRFEVEFSSFVQRKYGVAVCNGTAALEAAVFALGLKAGDEIILPSFTIISCALACLRFGVVPVLVDIDPLNWTMDVNKIENKITPKTKAIMAVHMYGHPVEMDMIFKLAEKYHLKIIEDAAQAHGAEYLSSVKGKKWLKCGAMGDVSIVSFYANKIITTGEGGMVLSDDLLYIERVRSYRNLCFGVKERFSHEAIGHNFRMTNLQAAVGVAQLEQIDRFLQIKRKNADHYREALSSLKGIRFMPANDHVRHVYWMYAVELDSPGKEAKSFMEQLSNDGIGTRPFFKGLHQQPVFLAQGLFKGEEYPKTEHAYQFGFYLPSGLTLTKAQINKVVDAIKTRLA